MKTALFFLFFYTLQSVAITSEFRSLKVRDSHLIFDDKLKAREIAITFAGKCKPALVSKILVRLKADNLSAHFFLTGDDALNNPELVTDILASGHVLGSQGLTAPEDKSQITTESSLSMEIQTGHEAVFAAGGFIYPFIRLSPRQGSITVRDMIKESGAFAFYWNIDYFSENPAQSMRDSLKRENYRGIAALTLNQESTLEALEALIEEIRTQDLTVITILPNGESNWTGNPPLIRKSLQQEIFKNGSIYHRNNESVKDQGYEI